MIETPRFSISPAIRGVISFGLVSVIVCAASLAHAADDPTSTRRFGLIVANNDSVDPEVESLEYADDDGARYYELFDSFTTETKLLTTLDSESQRIFPEIARETDPPSRPELDQTVRDLAAEMEQAREEGHETELYLVFTGHGDVDAAGDGYLSLANSKLYRRDIYREIIDPLDAGFTHLVVDACHAYFMVHPRGDDGGDDDEHWRDDRSGETLDEQLAAYLAGGGSDEEGSRPTVGVIASTAGNAEVHEWSRYRAGVFSHQLRSGLVGAADADGDGEITYRELEAYLVAANAAVTNPRARLDVYAHPPDQDRTRPLTRLDRFEGATLLEIPAGKGGRYHLEDSRGLRYADFHVDASIPTHIALLREPLDDGGSYYLFDGDRQAEIPLETLAVRSSELAFRERRRQSRGSIDEAFRSNLFETPFGPSFVAGFEAGRSAGEPGMERAAPDRAPDVWRFEASLSYGAGPGLPLPEGAGSGNPPEHHARASGVFRHDSGWGLGPFVDYGATFFPSDRRHHRISGGLAGSYRVEIAPGVGLVPSVEAGHTGYLVDAERLRSDPIGLHTGVSVTADWQITERTSVFVQPALDADLYTIDRNSGANRERWFLSPIGRLGVSFHGP